MHQVQQKTPDQAPSWLDHGESMAWAAGWNAALRAVAEAERQRAAVQRPAPEYDKLAPLDPRD